MQPASSNPLGSASTPSSIPVSIKTRLKEKAVSLAESVSAKMNFNQIMQSIKETKKKEWVIKGCKALTFFPAAALGAFTALSIGGLMATPVGWGIAGGLLFIGIVGLAVFGGPKGFIDALKQTYSGFTIGFGAGMIGLAGAGAVIGVGDAMAAFCQCLIGAIIAGLGATLLAFKVNPTVPSKW